MNKSTKDTVKEYIEKTYSKRDPIFVKDIYNKYPNVNESTIRSLFKRFVDDGTLEKVNNGIYALPNKESVLGKNTVYVGDIIGKKYLFNSEINRVGYVTGFTIANKLGLTSQMPSVQTIYSNEVADKRRVITIRKIKYIIDSPRVKVTQENYKLLQVMDLLTNFKKFSEVELSSSNGILSNYLKDVLLTHEEIEKIVESYPIKAQLNFYKYGRLI